MSDFDKEAERERLREKYERDQQKRDATEQMSELLLKGATMTNSHCENCADPIFRYDGEEFCPTCQEVVAGADDAADHRDESDGSEAAADARSADAPDEPSTAEETSSLEMKRPTGTAVGGVTGANGDATAEEQSTDATAEEQVAEDHPPDGQAADDQSVKERSAGGAADTSRSGATPTGGGTDGQSTAPSPSGQADRTAETADDALRQARASLTRSLVAQAQKAERCENPRRASDHLAAAREAAEALSALSY